MNSNTSQDVDETLRQSSIDTWLIFLWLQVILLNGVWGGVTDRADGGGETDIDSDTYSIEFKRRVRKMLAIMSEKLELIAQIWPRCSGIDRLRIDLCNGAYLVPLSSTVFSITVLDSSKTSKFKVT